MFSCVYLVEPAVTKSGSDVDVQWAVEQEMFNGLITVGAVDTLCWVFFLDAM